MTRLRIAFSAALASAPGAAFAHPGHVAEAGGHTHWLALVILGGLGLALLGWSIATALRALKRKWQT